MIVRRRPRREPFVPPAEEEGYAGPATLVAGDRRTDVEVALGDHFEPLDGRTHWYGRIRATPELTRLKDAGTTSAVLVVDGQAADVLLAEYDAWGNVAVRGTGLPPYAASSD